MKNWYPGSLTGRIYPDCLYRYHNHRKQKRIGYRSCSRNRRKDYQFPFLSTIFHAFYRICTWRTKYRCRQTRTGKGNFTLCSHDNCKLWYYRNNYHPVYRRTSSGTLYCQCKCYPAWFSIYQRIYHRLHLCRNSF